MFLGPAAVGKTSLRHGLMNQPLPDKPDSTILAQTRPVKYSWVKIAGTNSDHQFMAEVTEEDELDEEAQIIVDAGGNPEILLNQLSCSSEPHDQSLETPSHEEVEKHKQQVLAKAAYKRYGLKKHKEMWLHLWDCGGQPVFLDVLPAFLSSQTLFLLMFDASKSLDSPFQVFIFNKGERNDDAVLEITTLSLLQKWIASIHARFGDTERQGIVPDYPRIILVGTHGDQLAPGRPFKEKKRLATEILHRLNVSLEGKAYADMVLGTGLVVDNTTAGKGALADSGFRELHNAIFSFVQEKLSTETPVSWVHFRKVLQLCTKKKKPVIKLAEVYSIAAECHVPEGEVHSALLFYHELGVFLFYPSIEGLKSVVILEPQWLVDQFGELFTSWKGKPEYRDMWNTLTRYGVLVEPLYKSVLRSVHKHSLTPDALVEMLEHFLLAAPITTSRLHAHSGQVSEYFVPHMLQFYHSQSSTSTHSAKPKSGKVKAFSPFTRYTSAHTYQNAQSSGFKKAAPIHITFLSGYVPPGYYVRLATSLASIEGMAVLFHTGIYRNQISMDIGVDRLTITEHTETIELQFSRQESIDEPFRESCQRLLKWVHSRCFPEIHRWLSGADGHPAFVCPKCASLAQFDAPSRAKFCPFTIKQSSNEHLHCQLGHHFLPSCSQKYWLQYEESAIQHEQAQFEKKIHLHKPISPEVAADLAARLDIDPVTAVIHQYRRIGGDDKDLTEVLHDMGLTAAQFDTSMLSDVESTPSVSKHHSADLPCPSTVQAPAAVIPTSTTSTATASSTPGVHEISRDTLTASTIPKLISTTDRSFSGQDTSTNVGGNGVVSSTTSGESSLRGAVQPAALTPQPPFTGSQAHVFCQQPSPALTVQPSLSNSQQHGKPLTFSNAYRAVLHCSDWHKLGILLNVDYNTLEEISSSKREGPSACKAAMLDAWLKGNVDASWKQLADALKDMGDLRSSQAVEKYC